MGYLRNILFIFCCLSVGNTLFAATAYLFDKDDASYIDPRLPRIQADFSQKINDELDVQSSGSSAPAILEQTVVAFVSACNSCIKYTDSQHCLKKQYIFTYSGTSPPFIS
jgi:hypothetical protein